MSFAETPAVTCNGCGTQKRETNHWYLVVLGGMGGEMKVLEWNDELARVADAHICGERCAHLMLSRWLETRTLDAPAVRSEAAGK